MKPYAISKLLSANDLGETGGHQGGILVPKDSSILSYFPSVDAAEKNPRLELSFYEEDEVTKWNFVFIYYNNKFFDGTRNEYRLTWMTKYLRAKNAKVGDTVELSVDGDGRRHIKVIRQNPVNEKDGVLKLSGTWKVINL